MFAPSCLQVENNKENSHIPIFRNRNQISIAIRISSFNIIHISNCSSLRHFYLLIPVCHLVDYADLSCWYQSVTLVAPCVSVWITEGSFKAHSFVTGFSSTQHNAQNGTLHTWEQKSWDFFGGFPISCPAQTSKEPACPTMSIPPPGTNTVNDYMYIKQ